MPAAARIRGVTLRVVSQEVALGGKGSVAYPSLNVGPGEAFPVRIDMQLMRPTQVAGGPLVEVNLDGVLFQDLSFFGPDRLNSRRTMTAWEMEAQRDREYYKRIFSQNGRNGLQQAMIESLDRQASLPQLDVRVLRGGRAVSSAAMAPEHIAKFAFLHFPDAPVEPLDGSAQVAGNEASAPRVEVRNSSNRPVKYVELGWVLSDPNGHPYLAGCAVRRSGPLHAPGRDRPRAPGHHLAVFIQRPADRDPEDTGFVSQVEFADGKIWVPNRQSLDDVLLRRVVAPSSEEQRLSDLYRRKGLDSLIAELKKF